MSCLRVWNREIRFSSPLVVRFLRDQDVRTVRYQQPPNEQGQTYSGKNEMKCSSHVRLSRSLDDAEHVFIEVGNSHSTSSATWFHQGSVQVIQIFGHVPLSLPQFSTKWRCWKLAPNRGNAGIKMNILFLLMFIFFENFNMSIAFT